MHRVHIVKVRVARVVGGVVSEELAMVSALGNDLAQRRKQPMVDAQPRKIRAYAHGQLRDLERAHIIVEIVPYCRPDGGARCES